MSGKKISEFVPRTKRCARSLVRGDERGCFVTATKTNCHERRRQAQLIAMLKRRKGASIDEIGEEFGWQAHTVRGAIAGALKKKLGLDVISEKIERRGRVYRIAE